MLQFTLVAYIAKIGRNWLCPCGSKKKYKYCCLEKEQQGWKRVPIEELPAEVKLAFQRNQAKELIRQQQQGKGKPIISALHKGSRFVAVGTSLHSSPNWKTVVDFLGDHIRGTLGVDWGNAEISKPFEERHTIIQWYDHVCKLQAKHAKGKGEIYSMPAYGAIAAYMGLAYNLYLIKHNVALEARLVKRLKDPKHFQGAYYELMVAGNLIRAGFELTLEDEQDCTSGHCEFSAISKETGKKYWVEAKMRAVVGIMGQTNLEGTTKSDPTSHLTKHLNLAVEKPAEDGERLVFIDLNAEEEPVSPPAWMNRVVRKLEDKERNDPNRSAYVFITNMPYHRNLANEQTPCAIFPYGFGLDFNRPGLTTPSQNYYNKQKHIDAYRIAEVFGEYPKIPTNFEGELLHEARGEESRIQIGQYYFFDQLGVGGVVEDAIVVEGWKQTVCVIKTDDGRRIQAREKMTDFQLEDYKSHPEAYFGVIKPVSKGIDDPTDAFEWLLGAYNATTREQFLELLQTHPQFHEWQNKTREELRDIFCDLTVAQMMNLPKTPPE